ncbi:GLPGLI family protein [Formosa sp. 4Alg 33]|uniref:GLPGLI family protein n=1 Tax=Formosa sp. 4Alg 33 TaxID=3382189 RepID=UPI003D9C2874
MLKKIVLLLFILLVYVVKAQNNFSGKVTYTKAIIANSEKVGEAKYVSYVNAMNEILRNIPYVLEFNKEASYFYHIKPMASDLNKKMVSKAELLGKGKNQFYTNLQTNTTVEEVNRGSEKLLVSYPKYNFKLTTETKSIGGYKCYKATSQEVVEFSKIKKGYQDKVNDIVVWYTNEVPVSFGPLSVAGLPGLVLEMQYGSTVYTATKIEFKKKNVAIQEIPEGKIISKKEYDTQMVKSLSDAFGDF